MPGPLNFAQAVVRWQARRGRHGLPWQLDRDPYRVWLSEIMLQQTQVQTVYAYFERFVGRFPSIDVLAQASLDEVLALWSGLGYYSRARNLHRCARDIVDRHNGRFPNSAEQLQMLPGIGRSTAAAIASICFEERVAILDGNVRRVLSRYLGYGADLAAAAASRELWRLAGALLPSNRRLMPAYTQALMDLGALLCTARNPRCEVCPVRKSCRARALGVPEGFPIKSRKLKRGSESWWLLWAVNPQGAVWLRRQPAPGVWAGLFSFAMFDSQESLAAMLSARQLAQAEYLPALKHALTHKDLYLHPVKVPWSKARSPDEVGVWVSLGRLGQLGLPAPIKKMLQPP